MTIYDAIKDNRLSDLIQLVANSGPIGTPNYRETVRDILYLSSIIGNLAIFSYYYGDIENILTDYNANDIYQKIMYTSIVNFASDFYDFLN